MTEKQPRNIKADDIFKVPTGPYRGLRLEAVADAAPTRYGTYEVRCRVVSEVIVKVDYTARLQIEERS